MSAFDTIRYEVEGDLARLTLRGMTQHYVAAERMGLRDFVDYEAERHLRIAASDDTAEAFRAFLEKREPRFT